MRGRVHSQSKQELAHGFKKNTLFHDTYNQSYCIMKSCVVMLHACSIRNHQNMKQKRWWWFNKQTWFSSQCLIKKKLQNIKEDLKGRVGVGGNIWPHVTTQKPESYFSRCLHRKVLPKVCLVGNNTPHHSNHQRNLVKNFFYAFFICCFKQTLKV